MKAHRHQHCFRILYLYCVEKCHMKFSCQFCNNMHDNGFLHVFLGEILHTNYSEIFYGLHIYCTQFTFSGSYRQNTLFLRLILLMHKYRCKNNFVSWNGTELKTRLERCNPCGIHKFPHVFFALFIVNAEIQNYSKLHIQCITVPLVVSTETYKQFAVDMKT